MKDELKAIIEKAYSECREVMLKHRGKWTANGRRANFAFRSLEVACRNLEIPTPPLKRIEVSKVSQEAKPLSQDLEPDEQKGGDFLADNENKPRKRTRR